MQHIPYKTVNTWIKASSLLNPKKLIPSLMKYDMKSNPPEDKDVSKIISNINKFKYFRQIKLFVIYNIVFKN